MIPRRIRRRVACLKDRLIRDIGLNGYTVVRSNRQQDHQPLEAGYVRQIEISW